MRGAAIYGIASGPVVVGAWLRGVRDSEGVEGGEDDRGNLWLFGGGGCECDGVLGGGWFDGGEVISAFFAGEVDCDVGADVDVWRHYHCCNLWW